MPATILTVDFKNKVLLEHESIPKITRITCDVCHKTYKHTEGSSDNMQFVEFNKEVVMASGKQKSSIVVRVCRTCCIQLGEMFEEGVCN